MNNNDFYKNAIYNILVSSATWEAALECVLNTMMGWNDGGYVDEFIKASQHQPKESARGRQKSIGRRKREARFECIICHDKLTTNNNLSSELFLFRQKQAITWIDHYRSHLGLKKYRCKYCFKAFATDSILARHERSAVTCPGFGIPR